MGYASGLCDAEYAKRRVPATPCKTASWWARSCTCSKVRRVSHRSSSPSISRRASFTASSAGTIPGRLTRIGKSSVWLTTLPAGRY
ncbi:hypothetical protein LP414_22745 [Polaromonas sp. P1(28)-13]|nr:hypothetical protein LP414_22745 [Polaromonas sp. P1(28)-13]